MNKGDSMLKYVLRCAIDEMMRGGDAYIVEKFLGCSACDGSEVSSLLEVMDYIDERHDIGYRYMTMYEKYMAVHMIYNLSKEMSGRAAR